MGNLDLLQTNHDELAFTLDNSAADARKGETDTGFKLSPKKLHAIIGTSPKLHPDRREQGIENRLLADLKDKLIPISAEGLHSRPRPDRPADCHRPSRAVPSCDSLNALLEVEMGRPRRTSGRRSTHCPPTLPPRA
ncbi:hypothetical protein ECC04_002645 [Pseudomonas aeruginosa]|nr:hypothetical protein ECC04_002645 [Pseudomonas aeruginosa]